MRGLESWVWSRSLTRSMGATAVIFFQRFKKEKKGEKRSRVSKSKEPRARRRSSSARTERGGRARPKLTGCQRGPSAPLKRKRERGGRGGQGENRSPSSFSPPSSIFFFGNQKKRTSLGDTAGDASGHEVGGELDGVGGPLLLGRGVGDGPVVWFEFEFQLG